MVALSAAVKAVLELIQSLRGARRFHHLELLHPFTFMDSSLSDGTMEADMSAPRKKKPGGDNHAGQKDAGPSKLFGEIANRTSQAAGRALTFMIAAGVVLVWAVTGPIFHYSDTWQLVINTGTTIVTFLMVFLIQNSQNRDSAAIQVKLDELIRVSTAHNSFVGIEHLSDDELEEIRTKCENRAEAEKIGQESVEKTGKKAKRAADRVTG
jgi:low affinity Fe/Cu permease